MVIHSQEKTENAAVNDGTARRHSQWRDVVVRLFRNKLGIIGMCVVLVILILVIFAGAFTKYGINDQDYSIKFLMPCLEHPLGTDDFGRDIWTRLLYGGRVSLLVALSASAIALAIGTILGSISAYFGGKTDTAISRSLDIIMSIPALLLAISVSALLGSGPTNTALAISIAGIPGSSRIIRSSVLSIKGNEFVEAARATGSKHARVIFKHILPNVISPMLVHTTLSIGGNILQIAGLSFIGLGVQPPIPEWGSILADGRTYIREFSPMIIFPALFIILTLFGFNLLGDALRDSLDPKLKN